MSARGEVLIEADVVSGILGAQPHRRSRAGGDPGPQAAVLRPHLVLLDVRWALGDARGHEQYLRGHLPDAVFVDLPGELAGPAGPSAGRHPLPAVRDLEAAARRWGVRRNSLVVAYDATGGLAAARAWWLLQWAGHEAVRLLDGGLQAWVAAGLPLEQGPVTPPPGDVVLAPGGLPTVDADGVRRLAEDPDGLVLDARARERYRGEVEPIDPRAGHVPGAVSAPTSDNLDRDGRFLPTDALRARFAALGTRRGRQVAVYCGSGVTAAHEVAALAVAGVAAALYPGSWSQWSNDPDRPVATGPTP